MRNSSFRSLRYSSSCVFSICLARASFSRPSRVNTCTSITVPLVLDGTRRDVSFTSDAFSPKIARSSFSSGVSCVSPLGVTLPTRMSPGVDLGADVDDAGLVEVRQGALADVRDIGGNLLRTELRVARDTGQLLDVDRRETIFLDHALRDQDRVLEVVAVPGHEGDAHVLAQGQLTHVDGGAIGEDVAARHRRHRADDRRWLMQVFWFERTYLVRL
jgi:hypothetical protein